MFIIYYKQVLKFKINNVHVLFNKFKNVYKNIILQVFNVDRGR